MTTSMILVFLGALAVAGSTPASGGPAAAGALSAMTVEQSRSSRNADDMIERAFDDVLDRDPDDSERRRYRTRIYEDHWTTDDIRDDLRERRDYRSHRERTERDKSSYEIDRVIRTAYQDILGRSPDAEGLRTYRQRMMDDGWTERQLRDALRKSREHAANPTASADRMIKRVYQDVLGRDPDFSGLVEYRNQVQFHGWDEHDVRAALLKSPEYRQKSRGTSEAEAKAVVRRAYLSILGREPDPGSAGFVQQVMKQHWTERDVARELRNSEEYRKKNQ